MANKHKRKVSLKKLHQPPGGDPAKGCLTRHEKRKENNLCSHQWQGQLQAEADLELYRHDPKDGAHSYHSLCRKNQQDLFEVAVRSGKKGPWPSGYGVQAKGEGNGFWKKRPTCEGKEWNPAKGKNFKHFLEPYWHNAHHMVPNRLLNTTISDIAEAEAEDRAADLIYLVKGGLLRAGYNLNEQINMIILPNEQIVASALGLPRHLKGDKTGPDDTPEFRSHANYDRQVEKPLKKVIRQYAKSLRDDLKKKHLEPSDTLSKATLEQISKDIYPQIKSGGASRYGKPLAEIALKF